MPIIEFVFYSFLVAVVCQIGYYGMLFMSFALAKSQKTTSSNTPAVSVIVCAKNEADNLKQFIPSILQQSYPKFEVVLINDASSDDSLEIMEAFEKAHSQVKIVNVKNIEAFWGNKKYALTLGIKAASHDVFLFTDADCKPLSKYWIRDMASHFTEDKEIVLGYGGYQKKAYNLLNKLIRFETLMTAVQYFSYARIGLPYMGVGRNLAYRKATFYNASGFTNHMKIRSGDDDLFVNQMATRKNTAISFSKDSFTESLPKTSLYSWFQQKRRHVSTAKYYKGSHKFLLGLYYLSQVVFWSTGIALLVLMYQWPIVLSLVVLRFLLQYISIGVSAKKLNELDTLWLMPLLELFLILSQFFIFITNLISKPNHWR